MGKIVGKLILILLLTLGFLELLLRIPYNEAAKNVIYMEKYYRTLLHRVNPVWFQKNHNDPLLPPFNVYANLNFNDTSRLEEIRNQTRVLKNAKVESYDFLRHESTFASTKYTVEFNNIGLRRSADTFTKKPFNTRRIMLYGSYQAFGFALPENLTYGAQLEARLNKNNQKIRYEVLNSARMAGTAIVGYAHFLRDVHTLKPDLVIFDYGMVDGFIINDNLMPQVLHIDTEWKEFLSGPAKVINSLIGYSTVFYKLWTLGANIKMRENMINYFKVVDMFFSEASKNSVPVIALQQIQAITPADIMYKVANRHKGITFVNAGQIFSEKYAQYEHWPRPDNFWLNEVPPEERVYIERHGLAAYANLRMNLWQINENGHSILAEHLESVVKKVLP